MTWWQPRSDPRRARRTSEVVPRLWPVMPRGLGPELPKQGTLLARPASCVGAPPMPCCIGSGSAQRAMTRGR
eukprot:5626321-Pyramimonas_sp.AAC.1